MRDQSTTQNPQEAMTTEEFHRLLQENIERHADERKRHQGELSRIKNDYNRAIDEIIDGEREALEEYREARKQWERAQESYDEKMRSFKKQRDFAGSLMNTDKMKEANRWTLNNNIIQSDRHNIFERYRISGGELPDDASELLHPSWSRADKKKGGVSDEKK